MRCNCICDTIDCVDSRLVRIVVKFDNGNLAKINIFLKNEIYAEFRFDKDKGWKRIKEFEK